MRLLLAQRRQRDGGLQHNVQVGGVADLTVGHATNVDNSLQNITIFNYLFGPRYTRRRSSRFVPYGQVLLGGAKEDVNFQFTINRNAFGVLAGGGVTTTLKHRFGLTLG